MCTLSLKVQYQPHCHPLWCMALPSSLQRSFCIQYSCLKNVAAGALTIHFLCIVDHFKVNLLDFPQCRRPWFVYTSQVENTTIFYTTIMARIVVVHQSIGLDFQGGLNAIHCWQKSQHPETALGHNSFMTWYCRRAATPMSLLPGSALGMLASWLLVHFISKCQTSNASYFHSTFTSNSWIGVPPALLSSWLLCSDCQTLVPRSQPALSSPAAGRQTRTLDSSMCRKNTSLNTTNLVHLVVLLFVVTRRSTLPCCSLVLLLLQQQLLITRNCYAYCWLLKLV